MESTLKVKIMGGNYILVDISDEACVPLGFKHGTRVLTQGRLKATIKGVALDNEDRRVLWYELDRFPGEVCCFEGDTNLKEAGFKRLPATA